MPSFESIKLISVLAVALACSACRCEPDQEYLRAHAAAAESAEKAFAAKYQSPATEAELAAKRSEEQRASAVTAGTTQLPGVPHGALIRGASISRFAGELGKLGFAFRVTPIPGDVGQAMGNHADGSFTQLMGNADAVSRAAFVFTLKSSDMARSIRVTDTLRVFMRETGWADGIDWVTDAVANGAGKKTHSGVLYEVTMPVGGLFTVEAKPLGARGGAQKSVPAATSGVAEGH